MTEALHSVSNLKGVQRPSLWLPQEGGHLHRATDQLIRSLPAVPTRRVQHCRKGLPCSGTVVCRHCPSTAEENHLVVVVSAAVLERRLVAVAVGNQAEEGGKAAVKHVGIKVQVDDTGPVDKQKAHTITTGNNRVPQHTYCTLAMIGTRPFPSCLSTQSSFHYLATSHSNSPPSLITGSALIHSFTPHSVSVQTHSAAAIPCSAGTTLNFPTESSRAPQTCRRLCTVSISSSGACAAPRRSQKQRIPTAHEVEVTSGKLWRRARWRAEENRLSPSPPSQRARDNL